MSSTLQNLLIVLGLVVVAGLGYYLYTQNSSSQLNSTSALVANQASIQSADFLRRLNDIKNIELDGSIFRDPSFKSLRSYRPALEQVPIGRPNPFEPVD